MARTVKQKIHGFNPADDAHTAYHKGLMAAANIAGVTGGDKMNQPEARNAILDLASMHNKARKNRGHSGPDLVKSKRINADGDVVARKKKAVAPKKVN
jgi:hypothetical protein